MAAPSRKLSAGSGTSWSSVAFIVESMLLLLFLAGSLAILTRIFSSSLNESVESRSLDAATIAATSIAEHFAANPNDVREETVLGDLKIVCNVTEEPHTAGVLYRANIVVYDMLEGKSIYEISTARYESGVK